MQHTIPKGLGGGEIGMADTIRDEIAWFIKRHWEDLMKIAIAQSHPYPEDLVQTTLLNIVEYPPKIGEVQNWLGFFTQRMKQLLWADERIGGHVAKYRKQRPIEIHGDIDRFFRRRHGRRVGPKKGAE